jgi:hypothetical protein
MGLGRTAAAVVGMLLLSGCEGAPASLEGALAGRAFSVRSVVLGPPLQLGGNVPPQGDARIILTDDEDLCDFARRVRQAQARGEAPPRREGAFNSLVLSLTAEGVAPESLPNGTYGLAASGGPRYFEATTVRTEAGGASVQANATEGEVVLEEVQLREGGEAKGRLSLRFPEPLQGELAGEFTATWCEYL